jgi:hypothetical protein
MKVLKDLSWIPARNSPLSLYLTWSGLRSRRGGESLEAVVLFF